MSLQLVCSVRPQSPTGHQKEINGSYWCRSTLQKALAFPVGRYSGSWRKAANKKKASASSDAASQAIDRALKEGLSFTSLRQAIDGLKPFGAPSRAWWYKPGQSSSLEELREKLVVS